MENLKQKAKALAEAKAKKTKAEVKAALLKELRDTISVEEASDAVVISGPRLGEEIVNNSSLRDVAFLMRGVR
jgi:predicted TIM-barrel enzyme